MSSQQKALLLQSKQGAFAIGTIDIPAPGAGELLVKIESTALNPVEWKIQAYGILVTEYPAVLGFDAAGLVTGIGEGVSGFAIGDRVFSRGLFNTNAYNTFQ
ncbi:hypothetical protein SCP_1203120 [Sparassis crispa]|uniref:Alcohol dehydrogenase-like N-terminal domain-containing protein n=1 Tax=Sparassis crispa TaxID=139825 RepID=A0A401H108_9APHY|nr:hypothetical protein SCP_1203120 [Sparassis crispa]GBE88083.1 hypothetical protein SCP_1203120 [Sparassis crispa]